ncbi:MAG: hypothetical protein HWE27_03065 [Gammaproteobacteria bacterium]|nr:hypothetical protein [Gammaproteobacteria bacterium]
MDPTNRILFENEQYRLYSVCENVYLKKLTASGSVEDVFISSVYGDPDSALISFGNDFVAIAGCGVTIYFLSNGDSYEIGTEPDNIFWTEGIYQSGEDDFNFVRFTAYTDDNKIRVHRLDASTKKIEVL